MSFVLKDEFHSSVVESVYNDLFNRRSNYFYFIGRIVSWDNEATPYVPIKTFEYEKDTRNRILTVKKIQPNDVSFVVRRIDWASGTVYDMFDDYSSTYTAYSNATSLKSSNFYVLTDNFNVYKCLFNNNESASTIKPTGTDPTPITTNDGYVWKYLYTIPLSSRNRFLTLDWMPVTKSVLNPFYSNGEIRDIVIDNRGSGYLNNAEVTISVVGTFRGGTGNSIANLVPVLNDSGQIVDVIIKNRGNNYRSANVLVVDNLFSGASYYKGLSNVTITNSGAGYLNTNYTVNTVANIYTVGSFQPTSNAILGLTFNNNTLVNINIVNRGSGYSSNVVSNTFFIITTSGIFQPTTNASATFNVASTALLTPVLYNTQIDRILIEDPGTGYSANNQTVITSIGDGVNATFLPYVNQSGELEDIIITNRGEGYTYIDLEVVGDGTGANAYAVLSTGDLDTIQSTVELAAIDGAIYSFRSNTGGNNYSYANVTIAGDGSGFAGTVNLVNNSVSSITVTNPGFGYTYANVTIAGDGANANLTAILSPFGGHGSNPVKELFADTLMFYSTINNEKVHNISVNNDYRQFGIIKDLKQFSNTKTFANVLGTSSYLINANTVLNSFSNELTRDTILVLNSDNTRVFEVVEVVSSNNYILLNNLNNYSLADGDVLVDQNTASSFYIEDIVNYPTINKFSGDMLYIDNRTSVSYSDQQLVTLRTTIKL